jgi:hypothetical protein
MRSKGKHNLIAQGELRYDGEKYIAELPHGVDLISALLLTDCVLKITTPTRCVTDWDNVTIIFNAEDDDGSE